MTPSMKENQWRRQGQALVCSGEKIEWRKEGLLKMEGFLSLRRSSIKGPTVLGSFSEVKTFLAATEEGREKKERHQSKWMSKSEIKLLQEAGARFWQQRFEIRKGADDILIKSLH